MNIRLISGEINWVATGLVLFDEQLDKNETFKAMHKHSV